MVYYREASLVPSQMSERNMYHSFGIAQFPAQSTQVNYVAFREYVSLTLVYQAVT